MLSHKLMQIKAGTTANPALLLDLRYYSDANTPKGVYPERMRRNAENRLVSVSGVVTASFVFDGDDNRVKSTIASTTTTFVGTYGVYPERMRRKVTGSAITKYYYAGTNRIALRNSSGVRYIFGDHLGSTSITADGSGNNSVRQLYKAWGEVRYSSGSLPTKYQFSGLDDS